MITNYGIINDIKIRGLRNYESHTNSTKIKRLLSVLSVADL